MFSEEDVIYFHEFLTNDLVASLSLNLPNLKSLQVTYPLLVVALRR